MIRFKQYITEDPSKGLKAKAEKSGMPVGILRKVYNRGVAAWKTGHRPRGQLLNSGAWQE